MHEGIVKIGKNAFAGCSNLESLIIPSKVNIIEEGTFAFCESLNRVSIPKYTIEIGNNAFNGCIKLMRIKIPESKFQNHFINANH